LIWLNPDSPDLPMTEHSRDLPFSVDLWDEDELSIERRLGQLSELSIARMAFDSAAISYPRRMITLRGPGVCEVRSIGFSVEPAPALPRRRGGRLVQ
jgi:hypothetical protein